MTMHEDPVRPDPDDSDAEVFRDGARRTRIARGDPTDKADAWANVVFAVATYLGDDAKLAGILVGAEQVEWGDHSVQALYMQRSIQAALLNPPVIDALRGAAAAVGVELAISILPNEAFPLPRGGMAKRA